MNKKSKNLKEAQERFKKACKDKNPREIAIASAEILIYDKKYSDVLVYGVMFGFPILEKIRTNKIEISKLNSRQIRNFMIREWIIFKDERRKQKERFELSKEQERRVINAVAYAIKKLKKNKKITKRAKSKTGSFILA